MNLPGSLKCQAERKEQFLRPYEPDPDNAGGGMVAVDPRHLSTGEVFLC